MTSRTCFALIFGLLALAPAAPSLAEIPSTWAVSFPGFRVTPSTLPRADGGTLAVAMMAAGGSPTSFDIGVLELNAAGQQVRQRRIGGAFEESNVFGVATTGGYRLVAMSQSFGPSTDSDWLVVHLDAAGEVGDSFTYGTQGAHDFITALAAVPDGGIVIAGWTGDFFAPDTLLVRLAANGDIVWQQRFTFPGGSYIASLKATADGGFIAVGAVYAPGCEVSGDPFDSRCEDLWLLRLNGSGGVLSSRHTGGGRTDRAGEIVELAEGGFVVVGESSSLSSPNASCGAWDLACLEAFVARLNTGGAPMWVRLVGGAGTDQALSATLEDRDVLVGGVTGSAFDAWFLRVRAVGALEGKVLWQRRFDTGVEDWHTSIAASPQGGWFASITNDDDQLTVLRTSDGFKLPKGCPLIDTSATTKEGSWTSGSIAPQQYPVKFVRKKVTPTIATVRPNGTKLCYESSCTTTPSAELPSDVFEDSFDKCIEWPAGSSRPARCPPAACPRCAYSFGGGAPARGVRTPVPESLGRAYEAMRAARYAGNVLEPRVAGLIAQTAKDLGALTLGPRTAAALEAERARLNSGHDTKRSIARILNAAELDLARPEPASAKVARGRKNAVTLGTLASVQLPAVVRDGTLAVEVIDTLPRPPRGYVPLWPVVAYKASFDGELGQGLMRIGIRAAGLSTYRDVRVLQWKADCWQVITPKWSLGQPMLYFDTDQLSTFLLATPALGSIGSVCSCN